MFDLGACIVTVTHDRTSNIASYTMNKGDSHEFFYNPEESTFTLFVDGSGHVTLDCDDDTTFKSVEVVPDYDVGLNPGMQVSDITIFDYLVGRCAYTTGPESQTIALDPDGDNWTPDPATFSPDGFMTGVALFQGDES